MKLREKLARFLYGRYGADQLYNALFILELILLFVGTLLGILGKVEDALATAAIVCYILAAVIMAFSLYRVFSRDIQKRRRENQAWLRFKKKFSRKRGPGLPLDTATHIFRSCPHCASVLRLPRTPGKHKVKCPRCAQSFGVKVK